MVAAPRPRKERTMTNLSIIGTGNMSQAIASIAAKGGHSVQQLGQGDVDTAISGDVVVLAVPYPAVAAVTVGPLTTTVLIAGDDADAKSTLAGIVTSGGVRAVDAGSLKRARELEAIGFLQLTLAASEKISWTGGFGVVA